MKARPPIRWKRRAKGAQYPALAISHATQRENASGTALRDPGVFLYASSAFVAPDHPFSAFAVFQDWRQGDDLKRHSPRMKQRRAGG